MSNALQTSDSGKSQESGGPGAGTLPALLTVDLQDHLLTICSDLDRLQALLALSCETLMDSIDSASGKLRALPGRTLEPVLDATLQGVEAELSRAAAALQFQDMASQLIGHTLQRLRNCNDRLADEAFPDDEDGKAVIEPAPTRPNPVAQADMNGGSIDLF